MEFFNRQFSGQPRLFWSFGFGKQRQSLHESRQFGTFFEVHLWFYHGSCDTDAATAPAGDADPATKEMLRLSEDFHTSWNTWELRSRTAAWLREKVDPLPELAYQLLETERVPRKVRWAERGEHVYIV